MKSTLNPVRRRGSVLVTTLVMAMLVGLVVAALLFVARQQSYMVARAQVWASEIPIAEAGVEEAMSHMNSRPPTLASAGWTLSGTNFVKRGTFTNAYFYTTIVPIFSTTNAIISVGFARLPLNTNYTQRTVLAMAVLAPPAWGFVARKTVQLSGNPYADSYNSSDPRYSTGGFYDFAKRRDRAGVASLSSLVPSIDTKSAQIYGSAATGPGGTVVGNVGEGAWLAVNGGVEPGHARDDFNMAITDVVLPSPWHPKSPLLALPGVGSDGLTYSKVLSGGDWQFDGTTSLSGNGFLIKGKTHVYFNGDFKTTSGTAIRIEPGGSLDMYMGGTMDLAGSGVANTTGIPSNCNIYGLNTCLSVSYKGNATTYAVFYAPHAAVVVGGTADFCGSVVADTLLFSGTGSVHYDEALNSNTGPDYRVISWEEL